MVKLVLIRRDLMFKKSSKIRKFGWTFLGTYGLYILVSALIGASTGLGAYTFGYAKGFSYLTNDSKACANCHIMDDQYDAWVKSSHGKFASCNDCHAPHEFVGKYYCKARNGFWHSLAFTTNDFHEPIMMHEYNVNVVEESCRYCHQEMIHEIDVGTAAQEQFSCIRCHPDVGHATH
tara:strand:- start:100 stop:630 length:531 start_codon:yes stop_codon:yes gene_type:complete